MFLMLFQHFDSQIRHVWLWNYNLNLTCLLCFTNKFITALLTVTELAPFQSVPEENEFSISQILEWTWSF